MAFEYKNSKGKTYYLHGKMTTLKGGGERMIYFFAGQVKEGALDTVPDGFMVSETKSGLPVLKRAS